VDGAANDGSVRFQPLSRNRTRLALTLDVAPEGAIEKVGDALGIVERQIKGDLVRFREYIEARQAPTGAWRGGVHGGEEHYIATGTSGSGGIAGSGRPRRIREP
jgi:hypothetical protein